MTRVDGAGVLDLVDSPMFSDTQRMARNTSVAEIARQAGAAHIQARLADRNREVSENTNSQPPLEVFVPPVPLLEPPEVENRENSIMGSVTEQATDGSVSGRTLTVPTGERRGIRSRITLPLAASRKNRSGEENPAGSVPRNLEIGGDETEESPPRDDVERRDRNRNVERVEIAARRERQGEYMERVNTEARTAVHRGDIVIVYPDARDQAAGALRAGIPAIVINDPQEPGFSVEVITEHGILVVGRTRQRARLNRRQFRVASSTMQISDKLSRIQHCVRLSEMNLDTAPRIGMGEAHRRYHHVPRLAMCNCKTMSNRCGTIRCPCKKNGNQCGPMCGCGPQCQNMRMMM